MRSQTLTATFENWRLPDGRVLKAKFTISLTLAGKQTYRWIARIQTGEKFGKDFAESQLQEAKDYLKRQFERQLTEWADSRESPSAA